VSALLAEIGAADDAPRTELTFHPELIVRGSTGPAPVAVPPADTLVAASAPVALFVADTAEAQVN
jgi:LacI family transcriptional regulator, repressor for deo operon, udp, cdd, tsx, nupC, and nupG